MVSLSFIYFFVLELYTWAGINFIVRKKKTPKDLSSYFKQNDAEDSFVLASSALWPSEEGMLGKFLEEISTATSDTVRLVIPSWKNKG